MYALTKPRTDGPYNFPAAGSRSNPGFIEKGLRQDLRDRLLQMHLNSHDRVHGGLKLPLKFLDRDSIEYSLVQGRHDQIEEVMARRTLDQALALLDPVWGGMYHYSGNYRWDRPRYARTLAGQAAALYVYASAYALLHEPRYLSAADHICSYLVNFLAHREGGFYAGQTDEIAGMDAAAYFTLDDLQRRTHGMPEINRCIRVRENGQILEALALLHEYTGNSHALTAAAGAAAWLAAWWQGIADPPAAPAGLMHPGHACAEVLAAGRGMLQMFRITANHYYLELAVAMADALCVCLAEETRAGQRHAGLLPPALSGMDDAVCTVRFLNLLGYYTENRVYKTQAVALFNSLSDPRIATARIDEAGLLLADDELSSRPIRIAIAGGRMDAGAQAMFKTAQRLFGWYKVIHWPIQYGE
jgi:uncharacterized protein YyaL (SSP411 family)